MGNADTGAWPQRHLLLQIQRCIDGRHHSSGQLHGMKGLLDIFRQDGKLCIAQLCQHAVHTDNLTQLFSQRQQQRFTHGWVQRTGGLMQGFDPHDQQIKARWPHTGSNMLFKQRGKQHRIG
ncbi:hypothetical protein D3C80_1508830 [compost metagenome]